MKYCTYCASKHDDCSILGNDFEVKIEGVFADSVKDYVYPLSGRDLADAGNDGVGGRVDYVVGAGFERRLRLDGAGRGADYRVRAARRLGQDLREEGARAARRGVNQDERGCWGRRGGSGTERGPRGE